MVILIAKERSGSLQAGALTMEIETEPQSLLLPMGMINGGLPRVSSVI